MSGRGRRHVAQRSGVPHEELSDIPPFLGASPNVPQDGRSFTMAAANMLSNASKAAEDLQHDLYARWSRYMDEHGSELSISDPYDHESPGVPQSQYPYGHAPSGAMQFPNRSGFEPSGAMQSPDLSGFQSSGNPQHLSGTEPSGTRHRQQGPGPSVPHTPLVDGRPDQCDPDPAATPVTMYPGDDMDLTDQYHRSIDAFVPTRQDGLNIFGHVGGPRRTPATQKDTVPKHSTHRSRSPDHRSSSRDRRTRNL